MGKSTGFLEYTRTETTAKEPLERIGDFNEFHIPLAEEQRREQAARCMDGGIPFCQSGVMIAGMASGCPLRNLVPEVNDLVYRGRMEAAYRRLAVTHSFPEFTGRVCPALCEAACTCGLHDSPVSTKENEKAIFQENRSINCCIHRYADMSVIGEYTAKSLCRGLLAGRYFCRSGRCDRHGSGNRNSAVCEKRA